MAQAFFELHGPPDVRAESAGSRPAAEIHPQVVQAMREVGVDLSRRRPRKLTVEMQLHADWAVTLACGDECPYVPTTVEDWDVPDPQGRTLQEVRLIRDQLELRIQDLLAGRLDAIRTDRTAHQARLVRLIPPLVEEFGAVVPERDIRATADAVLAGYSDAPVRSFIMSIAHRRARERLRQRARASAA
jgi:arsenate reductase